MGNLLDTFWTFSSFRLPFQKPYFHAPHIPVCILPLGYFPVSHHGRLTPETQRWPKHQASLLGTQARGGSPFPFLHCRAAQVTGRTGSRCLPSLFGPAEKVLDATGSLLERTVTELLKCN